MHFRGILCAFTPTCEVNFGFLTQFWFICSEGLTALSRFSVRLSCMSTPLSVWLYLAGKTACCLYLTTQHFFVCLTFSGWKTACCLYLGIHRALGKNSPRMILQGQDNEKGKFQMKVFLSAMGFSHAFFFQQKRLSRSLPYLGLNLATVWSSEPPLHW